MGLGSWGSQSEGGDQTLLTTGNAALGTEDTQNNTESSSLLRGRSTLLRGAWKVTRLVLLAAVVGLLIGYGPPAEPPLVAIFSAAVAASLVLILVIDNSLTFRLWACYVHGIILFTYLRTLADQTFVSTKYLYVIEVERLLFFGHVPTVWLQERFHEVGSISTLDSFLVWIHLSYFVVPYAVAIALSLWNRTDFAIYVGATLATFYLGLIIYFAVPTSPPWLASHEGYLPEIDRVIYTAVTSVSEDSFDQGHRVVGSNDVAAMPSLHFAITAVIMLVHWKLHWIHRAWTAAYAALMGIALVYLGEHYVTDLLVGFLVALAGWRIATHLLERQAQSRPARDSDDIATRGSAN